MNEKRKQKIKHKVQGQKSLKTCKTCGELLNPYSQADYCDKECKKHDIGEKEIILNGGL